jgi:general secretion pathway protein N
VRARAIAIVGIAAYAVFLVAMLPASVVARWIAVPGVLELADARGTLWRGSARALAGSAQLDELRWRFEPARLAAGRLAFTVDVHGAGIEGHGRIDRGFGALEVRDLQMRGDAAALATFAPLAASWQPDGRLALDAPAIAWDGREARGTARIEWHDAAVALSSIRPLGSYRAEARADGGPVKISVTTLDGSLRISGNGTFAPPDALAFTGEARALPAAQAALEPLLNLMGPRRPDGARTLEIRTRR